MKKNTILPQTTLISDPCRPPSPPLFVHLNAYAELLFNAHSRMPSPIPQPSRGRPLRKTGVMMKEEVLSCCPFSQLCIDFLMIFRGPRFRRLTPQQKRHATAIKDPDFLRNFALCLPRYSPTAQFNLETGKFIDTMTPSCDIFFEQLLSALRVGWCSEAVLYLREEILDWEDVLEWLGTVAGSKLFEYNCDGEDNLLWFSPKSFHPLPHIVASQIQKQILVSFKHHKQHMKDLDELKLFLVSNHKNTLAEALDIPLFQFLEKPEKELNKLLEKMRIEEDRLHAINADKLLLQMQSEAKTKKSRKRPKKRKEVTSVVPAQNQSATQGREGTESDHTPSNESRKFKQEDEISPLQAILSVSYQGDSQDSPTKADSITQEAIPLLQRDEDCAKECHSDHHQSTNQNQRSMSQSESTSHLQEAFHNEDLPQNPTSADPIKEEKLRKRRKRRIRKEQEALEELQAEICHKFMTRQLQSISEYINASTNKMLQARVMAFQRVRILIQNNYPFSNAVLFGSNAIGLALPASDVDILIVGFTCNSRLECGELLKHIGYMISYMEWAVSCEVYCNAKVPVLKLEIDTSIPFMQVKGAKRIPVNEGFQLQTEKEVIVKVDITINVEGLSSAGYQSTLLMKKWLEKFPFAQKIVILFKHLLAYRHLNENYRGGIGSYCLFVMVMAYIQEHPSTAENELSRTFIDLLHWYSQEFNNEKEIVWLREDGSSFVSEQIYHQMFEEGEDRRGLLRLVDPTTNRIMSGSCSEYGKIKQFFKQILEKLAHIEETIGQELRSTSQNHAELTRLFHNRRQSEKWFKNAQEKHSWALMNLMGILL